MLARYATLGYLRAEPRNLHTLRFIRRIIAVLGTSGAVINKNIIFNGNVAVFVNSVALWCLHQYITLRNMILVRRLEACLFTAATIGLIGRRVKCFTVER